MRRPKQHRVSWRSEGGRLVFHTDCGIKGDSRLLQQRNTGWCAGCYPEARPNFKPRALPQGWYR